MLVVLFGVLSGAFFGALAVTVRIGLRSSAEPDAGATIAASATAQSDWVALSGATTLTRPCENASSRHT